MKFTTTTDFTIGPRTIWWLCRPCGITNEYTEPAEPRCSSCGQPPEPTERSGTTTVVGVDRAKGVVTLGIPVVPMTKEQLRKMYPEPKRRRKKR